MTNSLGSDSGKGLWSRFLLLPSDTHWLSLRVSKLLNRVCNLFQEVTQGSFLRHSTGLRPTVNQNGKPWLGWLDKVHHTHIQQGRAYKYVSIIGLSTRRVLFFLCCASSVYPPTDLCPPFTLSETTFPPPAGTYEPPYKRFSNSSFHLSLISCPPHFIFFSFSRKLLFLEVNSSTASKHRA